MSRHADTQATGVALQAPGMDTRAWIVHGVVTAVHYDDQEGLLVDVIVLPNEEVLTAKVPTLYQGVGWGLYLPVKVDSNVVVLKPDGENNGTPFVTAVLSSPSHSPPDPDDPYAGVFLKVEPGADVKLIVTGGGKVHIKVEGDGDAVVEVENGKVHLGGAGLLLPDGVVTGRGFDTLTGATYSALGNASSKVLAKR